ncbi:serine/arginine repetitive matrix protein 1-like [Asterias rubens]|uniref:serine/arginine repetitive matrix protein 1-like n=1 Tax=Asterias rubens TaxID=7604 RepID=UPI001455D0A1|nr:serine/arginine repetitive matrix protein 1-like [Asterias rubens]
MPIKGGPTDPQGKSKNFDEELRMKLKDRKRRGLTTGLSDTAEESNSDVSSDDIGGGDDFLSQFTASAAPKSQTSSFSGSSKPWAPPVATPRQQAKGNASPSPSPRGLPPSPKGIPSPRGLPSPIPRARTRSIDKPEEASKRRLSSSSEAVSPRSGVHPKDLASTPLPKPRSRTNTVDLDSPGRKSSVDSPRMKSDQSEVDKLLGLAPLKTTPRRKDSRGDDPFGTKPSSKFRNESPESRRKTRSPSIIDDLLGDDPKPKARSKSPEPKFRNKSPEPKVRSRLEAEESPVSSRKIKPRSGSMSKGSKSPELTSKNNSVLDDLLNGDGKKTKSRGSSPEPKGQNRSPSILDDLLNGSSNKKPEKGKPKAETDNVLDDLLGMAKKPKSRSGSPEPKPKPRSRGGSPPPLDRSRQRKSILDSDGSEDDNKVKRRNKTKSPSPSRKGSPKVAHPPPRRQKGLLDSSDEDDDFNRRGKPRLPSAKTTGSGKSQTRRGILDSSDDDTDDKRVSKSKPLGRSRSPSPKGFKTSAPSPKPRSRPGTADTKAPSKPEPKKQGFKVDDFLDSGSDFDFDGKPANGKPSLLDVLENQQSPKSRKKKKKMGRNALEDSDDSDDGDVFHRPSSKKKPPVISGRRPKEGYQSADEEDGGKDKTQSKVVKPTPKRPGSTASSTGGNSLNSSLNSSINIQDSSSIRQAIYDEWRAQKQVVLVKQAKEKRKKEKEEIKKKELAVLEKRAESAASFNAWKENKKGTLPNKAKEEEKKKKKLQEEKEKKMMQTVHAKKAFEAWKGDKDEHLKEQHRKKVRGELEKTRSLEDEKEMKQKDSQSAFRKWKSTKDEKISHQTKEKRMAEDKKKQREEEARKAKEEESIQAYEDWERKTERRKERDAKRMARTQPISTMPFRPSSKTIPYVR